MSSYTTETKVFTRPIDAKKSRANRGDLHDVVEHAAACALRRGSTTYVFCTHYGWTIALSSHEIPPLGSYFSVTATDVTRHTWNPGGE